MRAYCDASIPSAVEGRSTRYIIKKYGMLICMKKELLKYRLLLPSEIEVKIHQAEEGGFWAKVKTFPGVMAQGEDILDLIEMVNIAILDYLEVPQKLRKLLSRYEPQLSVHDLQSIVGNYRHKQVEELIANIIQSKGTMRFNKVTA